MNQIYELMKRGIRKMLKYYLEIKLSDLCIVFKDL